MEQVEDYFDRFCHDFHRFDGHVIAERFLCPLVIVTSSGELITHDSRPAIASYFQGYLDQYRSQGVTTCTYSNLDIVQVNATSFLATVFWQLLNADVNAVLSWRESYSLVAVRGKLKAFATFDH